jgi:putative peptidoglycan lipid II flippase
MNKLVRPVLLVTLLTFAGQMASFALQVTAAYLLGAGPHMDAFLAASAVPLYVNVVLLGSLGFVFVPVFVQYMSAGREADAWEVASTISLLSLIALGLLVGAGIIFADPILRLTAPGLEEPTHQLAVTMARILWPSVLATGMVLLLTSIHNSLAHFVWPAAVPVIGTLLGLTMVLALFGGLGVVSLAVATTVSAFLQLVLILPLAVRPGGLRFVLRLDHAGVGQIIHLLVPLALSSLVGKATSVVERYFASFLPQGSISHLNYALRIVTLLSIFIASGIVTVIFQTMATDTAGGDLAGLRRTISSGVRYMWLVVAPVTVFSIVFSVPLVAVTLQRGQFGAADTGVVALLFRIYVLSLAASCVGNIMARGFYVLKDTRTLALLSGAESALYVVYTAFFSRWWGAIGIALSYVVLFNGSLIWQTLIMRHKTGLNGPGLTMASILRTSMAALLGGAVAWGVAGFLHGAWLSLAVGGAAGVAFYMAGLSLLGSSEARACSEYVKGTIRKAQALRGHQA